MTRDQRLRDRLTRLKMDNPQSKELREAVEHVIGWLNEREGMEDETITAGDRRHVTNMKGDSDGR